MKKLLQVIILFAGLSHHSFSADIQSLLKLYRNNFNQIYVPRFCHQNIKRFVALARSKNINIENSFVVSVEGGSFLKTSGFYSRFKPGQRVSLGYFHVFLIADGYVFDFDLYRPLAIKFLDYVTLQFTPQVPNARFFNVDYYQTGNPHSWNTSIFDASSFKSLKGPKAWRGTLEDIPSYFY